MSQVILDAVFTLDEAAIEVNQIIAPFVFTLPKNLPPSFKLLDGEQFIAYNDTKRHIAIDSSSGVEYHLYAMVKSTNPAMFDADDDILSKKTSASFESFQAFPADYLIAATHSTTTLLSDLEATTSFQVNAHIEESLLSRGPIVQSASYTPMSFGLVPSGGPVVITVTLDHYVIAFDSLFPATISVYNSSNKKLEKISVKLLCRLSIDDKETSSSMIFTHVSGAGPDLDLKSDGNSAVEDSVFWLRIAEGVPLPTTCNTSIIQVENTIVFTAFIQGGATFEVGFCDYDLSV